MSGKTLRNVMRIVHLVAAIPIFMFLYSPIAGDPTLGMVVRFIIIPIVALAGLAMWQQPRVLKLLNGGSRPVVATGKSAGVR